MKIFSVLFVLLSVLGSLNAQVFDSKEAKTSAKKHILNLQKGALVVYLPTNRKKIGVLKNRLQNNPKDEKTRMLLNQVEKETVTLQGKFVGAYRTLYSFSTVYFMPDSMASALFDSVRVGIFVNDKLALDNAIELSDDNFYISYLGVPISGNTAYGKKSLIIADNKNNMLQAPFPYAVPYYSFFDVLNLKTDDQVATKAVKRQQKKLIKFFGR